MKKQFNRIPDFMADREWWGFDWFEHVTAIPAPLALVTGYKENGLSNGTMQSWFCFSNENGFFCIFGSVNKSTHMYDIARKKGCLVINFPDASNIDKCMLTIENNNYDADELTAAGLHFRKGAKVDAPVVDECFLSLECEVVWEKQLFEGSYHVALCVKIVNVWMDEKRYGEKNGRYGKKGYLYNVHSPINPENGKSDGESGYAVLNVLTTADLKNYDE